MANGAVSPAKRAERPHFRPATVNAGLTITSDDLGVPNYAFSSRQPVSSPAVPSDSGVSSYPSRQRDCRNSASARLNKAGDITWPSSATATADSGGISATALRGGCTIRPQAGCVGPACASDSETSAVQNDRRSDPARPICLSARYAGQLLAGLVIRSDHAENTAGICLPMVTPSSRGDR